MVSPGPTAGTACFGFANASPDLDNSVKVIVKIAGSVPALVTSNSMQ